jgi:hypothetical protein
MVIALLARMRMTVLTLTLLYSHQEALYILSSLALRANSIMIVTNMIDVP